MFNLGQFLGHVLSSTGNAIQSFGNAARFDVTHPAQAAKNLTNSIAVATTGHGAIGRGAPMHPYALPPTATLPMDFKASPIGHPQLNQLYNSAIANHNQNVATHLYPLAVGAPAQWQQGSLHVQPVTSGGGSYVNPFDTDTQTVDPMKFGSQSNYQGGQMRNPQLYNQMYRGL